jgi:hypothetical protein
MLTLLAEPEAADSDALELHGLSRMLRRRGEMKRARLLYEKALGAGLPAELDRAARRELAALAKRDRDYERATELWNGLLEGIGASHPAQVATHTGAAAKPHEDFTQRSQRHGGHREETDADASAALEAYEQLAIYYEHRARQPHRATELTRHAIAALASAHRHGAISHAFHRRQRDRLAHRLARLERKAQALPLEM